MIEFENLPKRIQKKIYPEPNTGCWLSTAAWNWNGYSTIKIGGKTRKAHRIVYELLVAPVPEGKELDHLCRTRCCVNPAHLEVVTHDENYNRGKLNQNKGKKYCDSGHEFNEANTYMDSFGKRHCRICTARWARKYRARKRETA